MDKISGFLLNKQTGKLKLILLYRYFSMIITSLFYLFGQHSTSMLINAGVIGSLLIAAFLVKDLLIKNEDHPSVIRWIVIAETVGITLLLLPTGGIESPFIWYAMNPTLIAASYLSGMFCWALLVSYMTASLLLSNTFFMNQSVRYIDILNQNSYLFLVLMLITIVFQLFAKLTNELHLQAVTLEEQGKELLQTNKKLILTNEKSNEAMEHIMSLYQTVEFFSAQDNVKTLVKTVLDFTGRLTKTPASFCWLTAGNQYAPLFSSKNEVMSAELQTLLVKSWSEVKERKNPVRIELHGKMFQLITVHSTKYHGFIGIEKSDEFFDSDGRLLKFLADLCSVMLERFYLKEASDQFLIVEEQNRIANEIHDSVSQRVFGLVFGLHSLKKKLELLPKDQLIDEIQFLSNSASMAMKELRSSIYQLSTKKQGETLLFSKIEGFLGDVAQLNDVTVVTDLQGDEEIIAYKLKNAIYRIVCEACGNALRHGKCKNIKVSVHITNNELILSVVDDGNGFEPSARLAEKNIGIGIGNMKNLIYSFGGKITFTSKLNQGTRVDIVIPFAAQNQEVVGL
ncbi:histidine kinase [Neobacillus sp. YX16]|uniref:sensor histidine kinase n=1 Tax=Neobacillus sp. YX16 TaxID=3047874 RepID=UPI0024C237D1|nr:ATP-binding protein [Neobacillus sp. YX16]WHZ02802.1 histidine kinase [Neobacillus sp. YX16]